MVGIHTEQNKLNLTLEKVCGILNESDINDWFIMFGTLLGIFRENSCIEGDDDLDIMINCDYQKLRSTFEQEGFTFTSAYGLRNSDAMLKTEPCNEYASSDFYMCETKGKNYFNSWQNVEIQDVEILSKEWRSTRINLPKNCEYILEKLYGTNWRIPIKYTLKNKLEMEKKDSIYNRTIKNII